LADFDRGTQDTRVGARTRTPSRRSLRTALDRRLFAGRTRRGLGLLLVASLTLGALGVAFAETLKGTRDQIIEYGPEDAVTGYPTWYRDAAFTAGGTFHDSVDLEPCLGDRDPMCLPAPAPDPNEPMDPRTGNFPDEFFYYHYDAAGLQSNGGNDVLMEAALEGAWSAEEVKDGDQVVFGRIRIRVEGLRAGSEYTVTHPQGEDRFVATTDRRGINYTQDIAAVPKDFDASFGSRVGPFLRWAPNPTDPNDRPPAGYIGESRTTAPRARATRPARPPSTSSAARRAASRWSSATATGPVTRASRRRRCSARRAGTSPTSTSRVPTCPPRWRSPTSPTTRTR
jgi:hypothetical protein